MRLLSLEVQNYRNIRAARLEPGRELTVICGNNGQGKTNLLEAIWLLTGGIIYTIGGVIYALKLPIFNSKHPYFGSHEIFHLFVMGGSLCHYIFMFCYLA